MRELFVAKGNRQNLCSHCLQDKSLRPYTGRLRPLFVLWVLGSVSSARAAVTVISTQDSSSPIAFSESGTFVAAGNFTGGNDTRGTNVFLADNLSGTSSPQGWAGSNGIGVTVGVANNGGLAAANLGSTTDDVYLTEIYTPDQSTMTLTINGLNPSLNYLVEFPHGENRNYTYTGTQTFTDSSNHTATSFLTFGGLATQAFSLIDVAVANSTSLSYTMPAGGRGPSFDAWDVRVVPEPGCLGSLCLAAPLLVRRRR